LRRWSLFAIYRLIDESGNAGVYAGESRAGLAAVEEDRWRIAMNTPFAISADGTRIAYDVTGQGPALVLIHGAGKNRQDWHKLGYTQRLQHDFTVITVDIRGTGESDVLTGIDDYGIEKICGDVKAVADACNAQEFSIWGYSFGGNIARYLGAWSKRVKAIAMIGVPFGPAVSEEFSKFIDEFVGKWGAVAEAYRKGDLSAEKRKSAIKGRIPVWVACFQAMRDWPRLDPDAVRCPALLLVGTRNRDVLNWVRANRESLERARVSIEIVEGLNHPQEFSQIERVYPAVSSFLKGHATAG
jgi:pimeloyl-ACP methyl ester carboxylesterase